MLCYNSLKNKLLYTSHEKPSLEKMWRFIDEMMRPNKLVPDRSVLRYEQVFSIYSKMDEINLIFQEIEQINMLKKSLKLENIQQKFF